MGTSRYPDLHLIEKPVYFKGARRIIPKKYQNVPIGMGLGKGRFSAPDGEFKVLYVATKLSIAVRETLIRDKFDNKKIRQIPKFKVLEYASTMLKASENLNILDLAGGRATNVGIPSVVRHSKFYTPSRRLALEVYIEMPKIDGFCYLSRLDDNVCFAIFDRAVNQKVELMNINPLIRVPEFQDAIKELRISIITGSRWQ